MTNLIGHFSIAKPRLRTYFESTFFGGAKPEQFPSNEQQLGRELLQKTK